MATVAEQRRELALFLEQSPSLRPTVRAAARKQDPRARKQTLRKTRALKRSLTEEDLPTSLPWKESELLAEDAFPSREQSQ